MMTGRVIELRKHLSVVDTDRGVYEADLRGVLKKRERVYLGDIVDLSDSDTPPVILTIRDRSSFLARPSIANLDRAFYVFTLKEPSCTLESLDKFLLCAEASDLATVIVVNKIDIVDNKEYERIGALEALYTSIGYQCLSISALRGDNLGLLRSLCIGSLSVFAGISGTGKSTIINGLFPRADLRTGELTCKGTRGAHTTAWAVLMKLPEGGYIADTPGFVQLELPDMKAEDVITCFPETGGRIGQCRFNNCTHRNEPGCIIKEMVGKGKIAESRYDNFLKFYDEMHVRQRTHSPAPARRRLSS